MGSKMVRFGKILVVAVAVMLIGSLLFAPAAMATYKTKTFSISAKGLTLKITAWIDNVVTYKSSGGFIVTKYGDVHVSSSVDVAGTGTVKQVDLSNYVNQWDVVTGPLATTKNVTRQNGTYASFFKTAYSTSYVSTGTHTYYGVPLYYFAAATAPLTINMTDYYHYNLLVYALVHDGSGSTLQQLQITDIPVE